MDSFQAAVQVIEARPGTLTEVVINKLVPIGNYPGRALKAMVIDLANSFAEVFVRRGYLDETTKMELARALLPYRA